MTKHVRFAALLALLSVPLLAAAQEVPAKETPAKETPAKPSEPPVPEAKTWVTKHRITIGGAPLAYTATAGTMQIRDDKDEPVALFGYTAYTKDGADRVSRPIGKGEGQDFWGVDQDARSVADFIVRYLNQNGRWSSPKYILGESYGGMRSGAVAYVLLGHNVTLNGVILVSPYMDAVAGNADLPVDTAYVNYLTAYASTAWYHKMIAEPRPDLQTFLRQAEAFARDVYAPVLFKGARATA